MWVMYALGAYLSIGITWVFYLAVMNLKRNRDQLTPIAKGFAYPMLAIGLVADVLFNFLWGTILFLELPRELLMTARLKRHLNDHKNDWRDRNAHWFCRNFLNPFDPSGNHC
jgi:hypothetical protein